MAACSSLRSLFETPLPEKPTLIESLTWSQKKHSKPMDHSVTDLFGELHFQEKPCSDEDKHGPLDTLFHSTKDNNYKCNINMDNYKTTDPTAITEIFGELHFQEKPQPVEESRCRNSGESIIDSLFKQNKNPTLDSLLGAGKNNYFDSKTRGNFSPKNSESLLMCTEGLGSESSDDVDDLVSESDYDWRSDDQGKEKKGSNVRSSSTDKRIRVGGGRGFPPPISSIGRSGKPRVCFKSYREGGRFVLREIRIPNHELLSASRHDGRLKLHFVQPELDIAEEEEEEQIEEEHQDDESNVDNREICGGKE